MDDVRLDRCSRRFAEPLVNSARAFVIQSSTSASSASSSRGGVGQSTMSESPSAGAAVASVLLLQHR